MSIKDKEKQQCLSCEILRNSIHAMLMGMSVLNVNSKASKYWVEPMNKLLNQLIK
jgi:hypothetical protein